jgi:hypothetical protein
VRALQWTTTERFLAVRPGDRDHALSRRHSAWAFVVRRKNIGGASAALRVQQLKAPAENVIHLSISHMNESSLMLLANRP